MDASLRGGIENVPRLGLGLFFIGVDLHGKPIVGVQPFEEPGEDGKAFGGGSKQIASLLHHQSTQADAESARRRQPAGMQHVIADFPRFAVGRRRGEVFTKEAREAPAAPDHGPKEGLEAQRLAECGMHRFRGKKNSENSRKSPKTRRFGYNRSPSSRSSRLAPPRRGGRPDSNGRLAQRPPLRGGAKRNPRPNEAVVANFRGWEQASRVDWARIFEKSAGNCVVASITMAVGSRAGPHHRRSAGSFQRGFAL